MRGIERIVQPFKAPNTGTEAAAKISADKKVKQIKTWTGFKKEPREPHVLAPKGYEGPVAPDDGWPQRWPLNH